MFYEELPFAPEAEDAMQLYDAVREATDLYFSVFGLERRVSLMSGSTDIDLPNKSASTAGWFYDKDTGNLSRN